MFFVPGTNAVDDLVRLQDVFLTEQLVSFLVGTVRANDLADESLAAVFIHATGDRLHLQQLAFLVSFRFFRIRKRSQQHHAYHETRSHH